MGVARLAEMNRPLNQDPAFFSILREACQSHSPSTGAAYWLAYWLSQPMGQNLLVESRRPTSRGPGKHHKQKCRGLASFLADAWNRPRPVPQLPKSGLFGRVGTFSLSLALWCTQGNFDPKALEFAVVGH